MQFGIFLACVLVAGIQNRLAHLNLSTPFHSAPKSVHSADSPPPLALEIQRISRRCCRFLSFPPLFIFDFSGVMNLMSPLWVFFFFGWGLQMYWVLTYFLYIRYDLCRAAVSVSVSVYGSGLNWILMFHKRSLQLGGDCNGFIYKATPCGQLMCLVAPCPRLYFPIALFALLVAFSHSTTCCPRDEDKGNRLVANGKAKRKGRKGKKGWALSGANMEMQFEW